MCWRLGFMSIVMWTSLAHADGAHVPEPYWVSGVTATSTYADPHDAYAPTLVVAPKIVVDDKTTVVTYNSAWCEGKPDAGLGESVTITLGQPTVVPSITIHAGVWKTAALFAANNIPTGLSVTTDDGRTIPVTAPPTRNPITVAIGGAAIRRLTITITAVKPGRMNDSCLTDVELGDDNSAALVTGIDPAGIAAYRDAVRALWATLWFPPAGQPACDAKLTPKYLDFPFAFTDVENTHARDEADRFVPHHHSVASAAALQAACAAHKFIDGNTLDNTMIEGSSAPNTVTIGFARAEVGAHATLAWRHGAWKLAKLE